MLSIVVAMTPQGVIGNKELLPWHMPSDLKRFRQITMNHSVVMGRKTFDSIITRNGKPLGDGRVSFVFTHNHEEVLTCGGVPVSSIEEVLEHEDISSEIFVIGGADIYKQLIHDIDRLYITIIQANILGDTQFPNIDFTDWKLEEYTPPELVIKDEYPSFFTVYSRKKTTKKPAM